ncbi:MAG: hypothetical protein M1377_05080 [Deltaproteobacteria bacterium]|nr:hypothetical protein [Deltaproteobacteria bacterium]
MSEKMTLSDKVLGIITRRGAAGKTPLLQGSKASSDELRVIVAELEREGKIKSWPYRGRAGTMVLYTLPDAKDPRTQEMIEANTHKAGKNVAPSNDATVPSKKPRSVNRKSASPPIKSRAKAAPSEDALPGPRKAALIAAAIALIEEKRIAALDVVEKIDTVLAGLRAVA